MSGDHAAAAVEEEKLHCASCGIAEIDGVKLKDCNSCDLIRYCSDDCQNNHRLEHEEECKKRAAELRDEILFKQPEGSCYGDCPICCLPIPLDLDKSSFLTCCSKFICDGCAFANAIREVELRLDQKCPFCREPVVISGEEYGRRNTKRVEMNDPYAIYQQGLDRNYKGDYRSAFEYFTKAAALGNTQAHFRLGNLYLFGRFVEKDEGKIIHHMEEAAIGGHPEARYTLGIQEWNDGSKERAVKHWIIAATQGHDEAIKQLMDKFRKGFVSKEELAATLRAQKAAVDATKSPQRKEAEESSEYFRKV